MKTRYLAPWSDEASFAGLMKANPLSNSLLHDDAAYNAEHADG